MTPLQLFGLICIFAVVRLVLSLRPSPVSVSAVGVPAAASPGAIPTATPPTAVAIVKEYLDAFIVAGLFALLLITFVVRTFYIPSGSMEPTLQIHDVLLVNEFEYRFGQPRDGDIVVFKPAIPSPSDFIKRLMAAPGDTLRIHDGTVYRNGVALTEPYIADKPNYELEVKNYSINVNGEPLDPQSANVPPRSAWQAPNRIPAGYYFMMGDNRNNSDDSHIWGFAQTHGKFATGPMAGQDAHFTGHAFLLFWPPQRARILK